MLLSSSIYLRSISKTTWQILKASAGDNTATKTRRRRKEEHAERQALTPRTNRPQQHTDQSTALTDMNRDQPPRTRPFENARRAPAVPYIQLPGDDPSRPKLEGSAQRAKAEKYNLVALAQETRAAQDRANLERYRDMYAPYHEGKDKNVEPPHISLREQIRKGELEKVVPPKHQQESWREDTASQETRGRPHTIPFHGSSLTSQIPSLSSNLLSPSSHRQATRPRSAQGHEQSKRGKLRSTISEVPKYMIAGAERIIEVPRGIHMKLTSHAPKPLYARKRLDSLDFRCVGVDGGIQHMKTCPRKSEDVTSSCDSPSFGVCQICPTAILIGGGRLCSGCTVRRDKLISTQEEIKPTPPLKDRRDLPRPGPVRNISPTWKVQIPLRPQNWRPRPPPKDDEEDLSPPSPPPKDLIPVKNVAAKAKPVIRHLAYQKSCKVKAENVDGSSDTRGPKHNTSGRGWRISRHEPQVKKKTSKPDSTCYEEEDDDRTPLLRQSGEGSRTDSDFYRLYDELLDGYRETDEKEDEECLS